MQNERRFVHRVLRAKVGQSSKNKMSEDLVRGFCEVNWVRVQKSSMSEYSASETGPKCIMGEGSVRRSASEIGSKCTTAK